MTKLAGFVCIAAFVYAIVKERRPLVFERGQALVLGILALALLSTAWAAEDTSSAITTTTRYASFALVYVILTQFGQDRVLQRRIAWTLTITCSIAAGLGLHYYLSGSARSSRRCRTPSRTTSRSSSPPHCRSCSCCSARRD